MTVAAVAIKSPLASKVNWIAGIAALIAAGNDMLPIIPDKYRHYVTGAVAVLGGILTIVTKTFYTTTISSASVPGDASVASVTHVDQRTGEEHTSDVLNMMQVHG